MRIQSLGFSEFRGFGFRGFWSGFSGFGCGVLGVQV